MDNFNKNLILVDNNDKIIGTIKALTGHYKDYLSLHRAFSLFLVDKNNKLIIQQRSNNKLVFPLMWANTVCSHPFINNLSFSDPITDCKQHLIKRLNYELGITEIKEEDLKYFGRVWYKATDTESFGFIMEGEPSSQEFIKYNFEENKKDIIKESKNFYEWEIDYIFICKKEVNIKFNEEEVKNVRSVNKKEFNELVEKNEVSKWTKIITEKTNIFEVIKDL